MQPDFFESEFDSNLKHLSQQRDRLIEQINYLNQQIKSEIQMGRSYPIDGAGRLWLNKTPGGSLFLYDMRAVKAHANAITAVSLNYIKTAIRELEEGADATNIK